MYLDSRFPVNGNAGKSQIIVAAFEVLATYSLATNGGLGSALMWARVKEENSPAHHKAQPERTSKFKRKNRTTRHESPVELERKSRFVGSAWVWVWRFAVNGNWDSVY
ncbi:hypothetical protein EMCG_08004 [[Emmonsia] crescens]|uniref:Uncharacterized protein n=1 Tax=[Emmonsia] crescens TaxID=73230 RepID=A0A0G2I6X2_9EURO|nr:hypothetical protein EMCG_08004 [Emmonsia crescens UAMH 3008]